MIKAKLILFCAVALAGASCVNRDYDLGNINADMLLMRDSLILPLGTTSPYFLSEYTQSAAFDEVDIESEFELGLGDETIDALFNNDKNSIGLTCRFENNSSLQLWFSAAPLDEDGNEIPGIALSPNESNKALLAPGQNGEPAFTTFDISIGGGNEQIKLLRKVGFKITSSNQPSGSVDNNDYIALMLWAKFSGGVSLDTNNDD